MKKRMRKWIALLLIALLLCNMTSFYVFAESGAEASSSAELEISSVEEEHNTSSEDGEETETSE